MSRDLPCITVKEVIAGLSKLDPNAKVYAWAPGSYIPVACVMGFVKDGRALLEINIPADSAIGQALEGI